MWDTSGPAATAKLPPRKLMIDYVIVHSTFNPVDSSQLFIASKGGFIEVQDVASGAVLTRSSRLHSPTGDSEDDPQYSSNGLYVAWRNSLYAIGGGIVIKHLLGKGLACSHISFSPDGTRLVVFSWDKSCDQEQGLLWKRDERAAYWEGFPFVVTQSRDDFPRPLVSCASFSPDSRFLAICSSDGTIELWNMDDVTRLAIFTEHTAPVAARQRKKGVHLQLAFSPDGQILCSAVSQGAVSFRRLFERFRFD